MASRDDRLKDEIQFHLEQQTAKNIRAGMTPDAARRDALVKFGALQAAREGARDQMRLTWLADFARDLRISVRTLARMRSFSLATVLTFGLGLGAAVAMFSVVNAVLLRPLPYPDADRIVRLYQIGAKGGRGNVSGPNFVDWREGTRSFAHFTLMSNWYGRVPVVGLGEPRRIPSIRVSEHFFDALGVAPERGRVFSAAEYAEELPQVAVISRRLADSVAGDETIGRHFVLDGLSIAVIGIMPRSFDYPVGTDLWLTIGEGRASASSRTSGNFQAIARLAPAVTLASAQAEISSLSRALKARYGDDTVMDDAAAVPILDVMTANSRGSLGLLLAASVLLLLVATVNVSNMLVARGAARRREFAVQLALGAGTGRLTRQILAETLTLCACGTIVGLALAQAAVRLFVAIGPRGTPRLDSVAVDWIPLAVAAVAAIVVSSILAAITAAGARSARLTNTLSEEGRGTSAGRRQVRLRESLIILEVALTLVLLAGGGLLARSLAMVLAINPGFNTDNALIVDLTMDSQGDDGLVQRVARQSEVVARLSALPGVRHVGLINSFPIGAGNFANGTFVEMTRVDEFTNQDQIRALGAAVKPRQGEAGYRLANGDYFKAMGIPLLRGRVFEDGDGPEAPHVAVISESLAKKQWPDQDPIGRYLQFGNMDGNYSGMRIVGVVGDVREIAIEAAPAAIIYAPYRQRPRQASAFALVVRGPAPATIAQTVRTVIHDIAPNVPIEFRTIDTALTAATGARRVNFWLIGAFGLAALMLASIGVYGLIAFMVAERTREMGIRMALGAEPSSLVGLIVRRGLFLAAIGAAGGLAVAIALSGLLEGLLFGVQAADPTVLAEVIVVTLIAAACASYLPARQVLKQTPSRSLREI